MGSMQAQMTQLLATLTQSGGLVPLFAAVDHPVLGSARDQVIAPAPENDDDAAARDQIFLDSLSAVAKNQTKKWCH